VSIWGDGPEDAAARAREPGLSAGANGGGFDALFKAKRYSEVLWALRGERPSMPVGSGIVDRVLRRTSCFVAGTPLLTPDGEKPIDLIRPGDLVLSRSENDPEGPVEPKAVLDTFVRVAPVVELHVGGRIIRTTAEHPFYVAGRGWLAARFLRGGDLLCSHDGSFRPVDRVAETAEVTTVYNVEVEDHHTYFVGCAEWGFSVWAHNADCARFQWKGNQWAVLDRNGKVVSRGATQKEALEAARGKILEDDYFALDPSVRSRQIWWLISVGTSH
jgi:hypothetical protein